MSGTAPTGPLPGGTFDSSMGYLGTTNFGGGLDYTGSTPVDVSGNIDFLGNLGGP
jgi:hypothetical protein